MNKSSLFFIFAMFVSSSGWCSTSSYFDPRDGKFHDLEISVRIPPLKRVQYDSRKENGEIKLIAMRFVSGDETEKPNWLVDGSYHVDYLKGAFKPDTLQKIARNKSLAEGMSRILKTELNADFILEKCKFIRLHQTQAYQCTGHAIVERVPARYVGTALMIKGNLINVYGLEPIFTMHPDFHWKRYNNMIESIEVAELL